jgi:type II secretory pathway pseudopilin PulG
MIKHNQDGAVSGVLMSLIVAVVLLLGAIGFGAWAFTGRQDYKTNVDAKVAVARDLAKQQEAAVKDAQFAEDAKKPLKTYQGPDQYGSVALQYPKTWSGYVDDTGKSSAIIDGFFAPGVVPSLTDQNSVFALRIQILSQPYAQVLQNFSGQQQTGKLAVTAYSLPKLPGIVGVRLTGQLNDRSTVTMVVLPLRSQTLQIWTEGTQYLDDFNNNILPNFSFSP